MSNEAALSYAVRLIEGKATMTEAGCQMLANAVIRLTRPDQVCVSVEFLRQITEHISTHPADSGVSGKRILGEIAKLVEGA